MKHDLLAMAIAELKRVHEAQLDFNYDDWGIHHSCGTEACAGGYLTLFKPFRDLGLGYYDEDDLTPTFGDAQSVYALEKFFDLPHEQASCAFTWLDDDLGRAVTALDVANKLQEYLDADAGSP